VANFEVVVVGSADPSPEGQRKLATVLAGRLSIPVASVAWAMAEKKLVAGEGLEYGAAQILERELRGLGATTVLRPVGGAAMALGLPSLAAARAGIGPALSTAASTPPLKGGPGRAAGHGYEGIPRLAPAEPELAAPLPLVGRDPFEHAEHLTGPSIGIATTNSSDEMRRMRAGGLSAPMVSPGVKGSAPMRDLSSITQGLAVDVETAEAAYRVPCDKHGLYYDTRKASGCRRCLEVGRKMATVGMPVVVVPFKLFHFAEQAAKRWFVGLAVALVIGVVPAAYHAMRVGAGAMYRLHEDQQLLSREPAGPTVMSEFEAIGAQIGRTRTQSMRDTALLWAVMTTGVLIGWGRLTTSQPE
jgi:hypothetical protein